MFHDTIVALITGPPPSAVAWVRLSGPEAFRIAGELFDPWPVDPEPTRVIYGRYAHGDDGLAIPFEAGHGYTGEEAVEMSIHGSRASIRELLEACERAGARPAGPGEFSLRAFLNGRIDLAQAEAVRETVESETGRQLREANRLREGALSRSVRSIRERSLGLLARLEASVDFSDEVGELDPAEIEAEARTLATEVRQLIDQGARSHLARRGLRVAITGLPNAGKSSLLNALLGVDRAIVTEIPGTTRDTIEEAAEFDGIRVVLIDTAGIRESADPVEAIGVERSKSAAALAERVLYVFDASAGWTRADEEALRDLDRSALIVGSKADLVTPTRGLAVSSLSGEGLGELRRAIVEGLADVQAPAVNERQSAALELAFESLSACAVAARASHPPDLLCTLLGEGIVHLGRVTGETASPDMLDEIFSRFCIGK